MMTHVYLWINGDDYTGWNRNWRTNNEESIKSNDKRNTFVEAIKLKYESSKFFS